MLTSVLVFPYVYIGFSHGDDDPWACRHSLLTALDAEKLPGLTAIAVKFASLTRTRIVLTIALILAVLAPFRTDTHMSITVIVL